MPDQDN